MQRFPLAISLPLPAIGGDGGGRIQPTADPRHDLEAMATIRRDVGFESVPAANADIGDAPDLKAATTGAAAISAAAGTRPLRWRIGRGWRRICK